ncbi:hypothetical protein PV11_05904 [Exophiala sideris]|uniref:Uncharacterized protein n=1 Tax=Exophiala sideris TaxID=1016849 RepID=A0A0D1W5J5_9EURO|nr:hypothetical protein PV11_05904 [Exophiala sideris]
MAEADRGPVARTPPPVGNRNSATDMYFRCIFNRTIPLPERVELLRIVENHVHEIETFETRQGRVLVRMSLASKLPIDVNKAVLEAKEEDQMPKTLERDLDEFLELPEDEYMRRLRFSGEREALRLTGQF